jgi:hypothetical protein
MKQIAINMLYNRDDVISLLKEINCVEDNTSITYDKYIIDNYAIIVSSSILSVNCIFDNDGMTEIFKDYKIMYKFIYQKFCIREKRISKLLDVNI